MNSQPEEGWSVKRKTKVMLVSGAGIAVAIQLYPVDRSNPPVRSAISVPAAVDSVLRAACYDCHSYETDWPWYSYIAPVSWFVANHVHEAREELNFSDWAALSQEDAAELLEEISEEVEEGEMPLRSYRVVHPAARLSAEQRAAISRWATAGGDGH